MIKDEFKIWLEQEDKSKKTIKCYVESVEDFLKWWEASVGEKVENVFPTDVKEYKHYLINVARNSASTVNLKLNGVKSYFNFLVKEGVMVESPARKVKVIKIQSRNLAPRSLARAEKNTLLRVVDNPATWKNNEWRLKRNRAIVYTLLQTGLRVSELINLELDDVDFELGCIYVRNGKGGYARRVEMNKEVCHVLKEWIKAGEEKTPESNKLFTSQMGEMTVSGVEHIFRRLRKLTEVKDLTPHTLRHTFGYELAQKFNLTIVAELMGHEDINNTRRYTKSRAEEHKKAVESLSNGDF